MRTRRCSQWVIVALAALACGDRAADEPDALAVDSGAATVPADSVPSPYQWEVDTLDARGFRAYAWGADTLWGITRGRLAFAPFTGGMQRLTPIAHQVGTVTGTNHVGWTNEEGLFIRSAGGAVRHALRPGDAPEPDFIGPELAWSPDSASALLTWTAEAHPEHTLLLSTGEQRRLRSRVPGYMVGGTALWLDHRTVLLQATGMGPRSGPPEHRESGHRGNLVVLDVVRDSMRLVTDVPDGVFLRPEGRLHRDTVLVAVQASGSWPTRHVTFDLADWRERPRVMETGRAAAAAGNIAFLRPLSGPGEGGEPKWEAVLYDARGDTVVIGRFQGHDVRLLWDASGERLAVAQESEALGMRTVIVQRVGSNVSR